MKISPHYFLKFFVTFLLLLFFFSIFSTYVKLCKHCWVSVPNILTDNVSVIIDIDFKSNKTIGLFNVLTV